MKDGQTAEYENTRKPRLEDTTMNELRKITTGLLAGLTMLGTSVASALELPSVDANGNEITITIPDDMQQAYDTITSDIDSIAQQTGVAIDELVASVSGCIRDPDGNPIIGAMVFLIKPDAPGQPLSMATTAGRTGIGFYSMGPSPLPYNQLPGQSIPKAGCYWLPIPLGLLDISATGFITGVQTITGAADTSAQTQFAHIAQLVAVLPGYQMIPWGQFLVMNPSGEFSVFQNLSPASVGGGVKSLISGGDGVSR